MLKITQTYFLKYVLPFSKLCTKGLTPVCTSLKNVVKVSQMYSSEVYTESCQASKTKLYAKIAIIFQLFTRNLHLVSLNTPLLASFIEGVRSRPNFFTNICSGDDNSKGKIDILFSYSSLYA